MVALRAWLWFVPVALLVASISLSVVAALDGRWPLLAAMALIGVFALGLMVFHWWAMYRFGGQQDSGNAEQDLRPRIEGK